MLDWNSNRAVLVGVDQITGTHFHTVDDDGLVEVLWESESVRHGDAAGKKMEADGTDFIEVAHGAVGQDPDTAERAMYVGVNLAPQGATGRLVEILDHNHARRWNAGDVIPIGFERGRILRRLSGTNPDRDSVAEHDAEVGKHGLHGATSEAVHAAADAEEFDSVGDGGRIGDAEEREIFVCEGRVHVV